MCYSFLNSLQCPSGQHLLIHVSGHELYAEAVNNKKVFELAQRSLPWSRQTIREQELVKVIGIKYEIKPPRLCCLKVNDRTCCHLGKNVNFSSQFSTFAAWHDGSYHRSVDGWILYVKVSRHGRCFRFPGPAPNLWASFSAHMERWWSFPLHHRRPVVGGTAGTRSTVSARTPRFYVPLLQNSVSLEFEICFHRWNDSICWQLG